MILADIVGIDQCPEKVADHWRVLELISAGAAGHEEAAQAAFVI